jgi:hypothetical protein
MTPERTTPPQWAVFGSGCYATAAIVITRPEGGWHVTGVLHRTADGPVQLHPSWPERWASGPDAASVEVEWNYLANRILDGRGGNYYSYEIEGFEVADPSDIGPLVNAREAEIVVSTHGPLGEIGGTFDTAYTIDGVIMSFVVLMDDRGYPALVATDAADSIPCSVSPEGGTLLLPVAFESVADWQRSGALSWRLDPEVVHEVRWEDSSLRIAVDVNAKIIGISH